MSKSAERLACWKIAKRISSTQLTDSVEETADRIFRWDEASSDPPTAFDCILAAMDVRTGGASIDQLLTQATEAYTFASSSDGAASKHTRKKGSRRRGPSSR